jgi:hypothetical protein
MSIAPFANTREIQNIELVGVTPKSGRIHGVEIKIQGRLRNITLPAPGADRSSFSMAQANWGDSQILALTLDERGRIPAVAYFDMTTKGLCLIGEYAPLIVDPRTQLVVEAMYSSASKQIINRYTYKDCKMRLHDQLIDQVLDTESIHVIRRSVARVKGDAISQPACEYEIRDGQPVNDEACFQF